MSYKKEYDDLFLELKKMYEENEARNMVNILFEDIYSWNPNKADKSFDQNEIDRFTAYAQRLKDGEPIQYVTGIANFYGHFLNVTPAVLIPRPETEELVSWILEDEKGKHTQQDVLDIGTGSGCIPIALKLKKPNFRVFAIEISLDALNVARLNAKRLKANIQFFRIDILEKEVWPLLGKMDIIISNPPYISASEKDLMLKQVIEYEPAIALFVQDEDPLMFYRVIGEFSFKHLNQNGKLYLETNEFNALQVSELLQNIGFASVQLRKDMQGKDRMIRAIKAG